MKSKIGTGLLLVLLLSCIAATESLAKKKSADSSTLRREETMVLNLNTGSKSAKFFVLQSLRTTRETQKNLTKAIRQVEQVDSNYAKARQRPDDRTLAGTAERLKQAQATAEKLEKDLDQVNVQLKSDIQSTLIH